MDENRFYTGGRGNGKTMQESVLVMAEGNPGSERELDDIIIELLMQDEVIEPEGGLTEKHKELIKEAAPLCRETKAYQRSYCKMRGKRGSSKELYMEMLLKMAMAPTRLHTVITPRIFIPYIYEALLAEGAYKDGK